MDSLEVEDSLVEEALVEEDFKKINLILSFFHDLKLDFKDVVEMYETLVLYGAFYLWPKLNAENVVESSMKTIEILQW